MKQIFYHATSKENWEKIKKENILFGVRNAPSRCTYLSTTIKDCEQYGEVILKVLYDPNLHKDENNWCEDCWQIRVYEPIELNDIEIVKNISR